jgi:hypothetical protein
MKRFFVGVAALVASAYACDDNPQSHVYIAALYQPASSCFGPSTSLGQVDTPDGDLDCAPTCLVLVHPGATNDVYVSTMCGPYPSAYDTSQTDPGCPPALAAWPAEQAALASASSSCASPPAPGDAGEDGGGDAGSDSAPSDDGEASDASASDGASAVDAADGGGDASGD